MGLRSPNIARFNYILRGGFQQDSYFNQHFDVHGIGDGGYGGTAGEYFEIAYNTIRGEQTYYAGFKTRPSFMLRGGPTIGAYFHDNVDVHDDLDAAVSLKWSKGDLGIFGDDSKFHFHADSNEFNTDHAADLATGDFDGDGRTDVFVATGTAWFFSRGGSQPWEFLHASTKGIGELGFADIDNDGITDVLWRDRSGSLGYLNSGTRDGWSYSSGAVQGWVKLNNKLTGSFADAVAADFDGDGKSDIAFKGGGSWHFSSGGSRPPITMFTAVPEPHAWNRRILGRAQKVI